MTSVEYLSQPYGRVVVPEPDGSYRAEIIEFPGCIATGETASDALSNLERVAESWLEVTLAKGQSVPEPIENTGYSGKLMLRLPKSLHRKAAHAAQRDGVSLNQFIIASIAEQVGNTKHITEKHVLNNTYLIVYAQTNSTCLQPIPAFYEPPKQYIQLKNFQSMQA